MVCVYLCCKFYFMNDKCIIKFLFCISDQKTQWDAQNTNWIGELSYAVIFFERDLG